MTADTYAWLKDIRAGDKVVVVEWYGGLVEYVVARTTSTQIIVGGRRYRQSDGRYRKSDGRKVGSHKGYLIPATAKSLTNADEQRRINAVDTELHRLTTPYKWLPFPLAKKERLVKAIREIIEQEP